MQDSPFFEDAERRQRYLDFTGYHSSTCFHKVSVQACWSYCTVKSKELEDLAEAVRTENYRLHALQAQRQWVYRFCYTSVAQFAFEGASSRSRTWKVNLPNFSNRIRKRLTGNELLRLYAFIFNLFFLLLLLLLSRYQINRNRMFSVHLRSAKSGGWATVIQSSTILCGHKTKPTSAKILCLHILLGLLIGSKLLQILA